MLHGSILFGPRIGWLAVAGVVVALVRVVLRRPMAWALLVAPAVYVALNRLGLVG